MAVVDLVFAQPFYQLFRVVVVWVWGEHHFAAVVHGRRDVRLDPRWLACCKQLGFMSALFGRSIDLPSGRLLRLHESSLRLTELLFDAAAPDRGLKSGARDAFIELRRNLAIAALSPILFHNFI